MEKAQIGVVSPGPEFSATVQHVARDLDLTVTVGEEAAQDPLATVLDWERRARAQIVIARGGTAFLLKRRSSLPVVPVDVSGLDLAEAIRRAGAPGSRVTFLDAEHGGPRYDYEKIAAVAGVEFAVRLYRSSEEGDRILAGLDGAVVGTEARLVGKASALGRTAVLVQPGREMAEDALKKASYICHVRRRQAYLCHSLHAVLSNAYDGVMAVEKDRVTLFNHVAERITGLRAGEVLGRAVAAVCRANAACRILYGDGAVASGALVYLGEVPLVVNRRSGEVDADTTATLITFQAADKIRRIEARLRQELHSRGLVAKFRFPDIVGHSAALGEAVQEARKYAQSAAAVLITGESGTGKELFAQSIHNESIRRDGPFVAINCAALPESLLESELFGYEEGAFTGAKKGGKQGLFTVAHGGTIFLDEVGELSPGLQARLLRVLQEKEVMPVGGQKICLVDVRVISSTNRNLAREVEEGRFRRDLFFRLNVLHLHIPSLRERLEDVPELFIHFLEGIAGPAAGARLALTPALLQALQRHLWPGNARELQTFAERYVALGEADTLTHPTFFALLAKLTSSGLHKAAHAAPDGRLSIELGPLPDMERQILIQASRLIKGNKLEMARILGISRTTLWKKLKELQMY